MGEVIKLNHLETFERRALIIRLLERMREKDSWCGETHVQKATYFLQKLFGTPINVDFILYKHGPFSFDLRDELGAMLAGQLVTAEIRRPGYGPSLTVNHDVADGLTRHYQSTIARYEPQLAFVAEHLGDRSVGELERLATALFVTVDWPTGSGGGRTEATTGPSQEERARRVTELKPHIPFELALHAVVKVDQLRERAGAVASCPD